jgi:SAM-dependent methyltransferase
MASSQRPPRLPRSTVRAITRRFLTPLPRRLYVRAKLGDDPFYAAAVVALGEAGMPVLDLGCGIGLLAHALHLGGMPLPYLGLDFDAGKRAVARRATAAAGLPARFATADFLADDIDRALSAHAGSVVLCDVLQYLPEAAQQRLVLAACARVGAGGVLLLRSGLMDASARARFTRAVDVISHRVGWMQSAPAHYPGRDELDALIAAAGLRGGWRPMNGRAPYNNWLLTARH